MGRVRARDVTCLQRPRAGDDDGPADRQGPAARRLAHRVQHQRRQLLQPAHAEAAAGAELRRRVITGFTLWHPKAGLAGNRLPARLKNPGAGAIRALKDNGVVTLLTGPQIWQTARIRDVVEDGDAWFFVIDRPAPVPDAVAVEVGSCATGVVHAGSLGELALPVAR
jgi:hypothetical protein